MFRKFVLGLIVLICSGNFLRAQQKVNKAGNDEINIHLKNMQEKYAAGERKTSFMKEYVNLLMEKGTVSDLEKVADVYLKRIPFKKRYIGENWKIFEKGVRKYNAVTFRNFVENYDKLKHKTKDLAVSFVENVYRQNLIYERMKKQMDSVFIRSMKEDLYKVGSSNFEYYSGLLDMSVAADKKDIKVVIYLFKRYADKDKLSKLSGLSDLTIMGNALSKVLDLADEEVCEEMIVCLEPFVDSKTQKGLFKDLYGSFKGKLLVLRNEKVPKAEEKEMKYIDHVDGFYFNTSVGGVMTDKEYNILKKAFTSNNDSLKNYYLQKIPFVFRYNGYTHGLEELKPLIVQNFKNSKLKEEVISLYDAYAHLAPGKMAPEFCLKDVNGKEYALSDYRGKVVVVDVWATWCGGCIAKLPYFLKLYEKYKNKDDIVFMTISIDRKSAYTTWKYALPRYNLTEIISLIALQDESEFSKVYNVTGIPRYFIIDRDGKIVTVYAPNPNNTKFEQMILEVLDNK